MFCWGGVGWCIACYECVLRYNCTELGDEVQLRIVLNAVNGSP